MGTLGCINDMLRKDKENRELRKRNHEKFYETRERLFQVRKSDTDCNLSIEDLEKVRKEITEKERKDRMFYFSFFIKFLLICVTVMTIVALIIYCS